MTSDPLANVAPDKFATLVEELKLAAGLWCYHGRSARLEEFALRLLAAPPSAPPEKWRISAIHARGCVHYTNELACNCGLLEAAHATFEKKSR